MAGVGKANRYPRAVKETAPHDQRHAENDLGKGANAGRDPDGGDCQLPIQGSGTFNAQQTSTETNGGCSTVLTTGTFNGAFRARFAGWGARTLRLNPADDARYREDL
jgi:hypothetical protein